MRRVEIGQQAGEFCLFYVCFTILRGQFFREWAAASQAAGGADRSGGNATFFLHFVHQRADCGRQFRHFAQLAHIARGIVITGDNPDRQGEQTRDGQCQRKPDTDSDTQVLYFQIHLKLFIPNNPLGRRAQ